MKRITFALVSLLALSGFGILIWFSIQSRDGRTKVFELPEAPQAKKITAKLDERCYSGLISGPPIPEFEIPREFTAAILDCMRPAEVQRDDWFKRFGAIGHLTITTSTDDTLEVAIFPAGVNPLCFTVDGTSCMRGGTFQSFNPAVTDANWHADESVLFVALIAEMYRVRFEEKDRKRLDQLIEKLKISRGELPPPNQ